MCYTCLCWKLGDDIEKGLQYKAETIVIVYWLFIVYLISQSPKNYSQLFWYLFFSVKLLKIPYYELLSCEDLLHVFILHDKRVDSYIIRFRLLVW